MNILSIVSFFQNLFNYSELYIPPLIAGIIIGVLAPLMGAIIVIRRLSFIADTLSHFSLAGICLGTLLAQTLSLSINLDDFTLKTLLGIIFSIIGTLLIEKLRNFYRNYKELSMPIVMSLGVALSGIFIYLAGSSSNATNTFLFGSLMIVSKSHLPLIFTMTFIIILFITIFYRKIICLCFDEVYAKVSGINVRLLQFSITIILAIFISVFMQMVGVLLISSLMIVPVAASILIGKSFKNTCLIAIVFSEISILMGFILGDAYNLPSGSVIVIINIFILTIVTIVNTMHKRHKDKPIVQKISSMFIKEEDEKKDTI